MRRGANKQGGSAAGDAIPQNAEQLFKDFVASVHLTSSRNTEVQLDLVTVLRNAQGPSPGVSFETAKKIFDERVAGRDITQQSIRHALAEVESEDKRAELVKTLAMFTGSVVKPFAEELLGAGTDFDSLMGASALLYCDEGRGATACLSLYSRLTHSKAKHLPIQPYLVLNSLQEYLNLRPSERIQRLVDNLRAVENVRRGCE